jgi:hypothetical protein
VKSFEEFFCSFTKYNNNILGIKPFPKLCSNGKPLQKKLTYTGLFGNNILEAHYPANPAEKGPEELCDVFDSAQPHCKRFILA